MVSGLGNCDFWGRGREGRGALEEGGVYFGNFIPTGSPLCLPALRVNQVLVAVGSGHVVRTALQGRPPSVCHLRGGPAPSLA